MNKTLFMIIAFIFGTAVSCSNPKTVVDIWYGYDYLGSVKTSVKLLTDNNNEVGSVTFGIEKIGNSGYLTANYELKNGWEMATSQLYVGKQEEMPVFDPNNIKSNQFPFVDQHVPRVKEFTQFIPICKLPVHQPEINIAVIANIRSIEGDVVNAFATDAPELLSKL